MNFNTIISRSGTLSLKWNAPRLPLKSDVIPLWVADMDFCCPEVVTDALKARLSHPVFGYTDADPEYFAALRAWYAGRYGANIDADALSLGPGAVPSMGIIARTFCGQGDGVLIMPPVYGPFARMVRDNGRTVVEAPLNADDPFRMKLDLDAADAAVAAAEERGLAVRLILFCSPHNPGGVVWTPEELSSLLAFAAKRDLLVVSDEIHGDLALKPNVFTSLAGFPAAAERTIVFSAPNKTFNLAGLHLSHFVAENAELRSRLRRGIAAAGYGEPNALSQVAARAAYERGGPWLDELLDYLRANAEYAAAFVNENLPGVRGAVPDGSYLLWLNASALIAERGLADDRELVARLENEARIKLNPGSAFGAGGTGFVRMNIACPRPLLSEALERFADWTRVGASR